ncbi:MAG: hypothetical protein WKF88_09585 [Ferruginibacter sp.]
MANPLRGGSFDVQDQQLIGLPENEKMDVVFNVTINDKIFSFSKPLLYKFTDPVKGELYEPVVIVPSVSVSISPSLVILSSNRQNTVTPEITVQANADLEKRFRISSTLDRKEFIVADTLLKMKKDERRIFRADINGIAPNSSATATASVTTPTGIHQTGLRKISYDHIPDIYYEYRDSTRIAALDIKTVGTRAGYIAGAGDKVPDALMQMGYRVTILEENDIIIQNLKQFDVIITGVRAYNIHTWLTGAYSTLMNYVKEGGVLLVQYNTNNSLGPVKATISPYPFIITNKRITDETATVNFLLPQDPVLNYPNRITANDFTGWVQERSIYHAENIDSAFRKPLGIKDPGENEQAGSLIVADYGKGKFIYTGLVFFRELPAGVTGAYRLFANLIAGRRD